MRQPSGSADNLGMRIILPHYRKSRYNEGIDMSWTRLSTATFAAVAAFALVAGCGSAGSSSPATTSTPTTPTGTTSVTTVVPALSVFPADNAWNQRVDSLPVDPNSATIIAAMNPTRGLHPDFGSYTGYGIPYCIVPGTQPRVPVAFDYPDESDPGPYPIPANAPIEGGSSATGDRHILVIDKDAWKLYEVWNAQPDGKGGWKCGSGAIFDLKSNVLRPAGWTSADAAGLPIFPGLVRYDEMVEKHAITHALRFTMVKTRRAYIAPARHFASSRTDPSLPPMGLRVRLKASVDISKYSANVQVLLTAMKRYGLILADNGSDWFISGTSDARFNDDDLHTIGGIKGSDFEVVKMGEVVTK